MRMSSRNENGTATTTPTTPTPTPTPTTGACESQAIVGVGGFAVQVRDLLGLCQTIEGLARTKASASAGILLRAVGEICTRMGTGMGGEPVVIAAAHAPVFKMEGIERIRAAAGFPATPTTPSRTQRGRARGARKGPRGGRGGGGAKGVRVRSDSVLCPDCGAPGKLKGQKRAEGPYRECKHGHRFTIDGTTLISGSRGEEAPPRPPRGPAKLNGAKGSRPAPRGEGVGVAVEGLEDATERRLVMALGANGGRLGREALLKEMDRTNWPGQAVEELKDKGFITLASDGPGKTFVSLTVKGTERYEAQKAADKG